MYWTVKDGERWTIALSEREAWEGLKTFWGDEEHEHAKWSVERTEEEVPVVQGKVVQATEGQPHVWWVCPYTGEEFFADCEPGERRPALCYCANGSRTEKMALVDWEAGR